jgi:SET domain-containing protein
MGRGLAVQEGRHGRGVFATRGFAKGDRVEVCPTLELPDADVTGELSDYVYQSNEDDDTVLLLFGFGMLYNHSSRPNLEYVQSSANTMTFLATRKIKPGDELTIDYGDHWWDERGLEPD